MRRRRQAPGGEAGLTLVELLVVMLLMGVVANIAIPNLVRARLRARATAIVADVTTVRTAAMQYHTRTSRWPPDTGPGVVPAELAPILESSVTWARGRYDLEWENWADAAGNPTHPGTGVLVGLSIRTPDTELLNVVEEVWGTRLPRRADGLTFPIVPVAP